MSALMPEVATELVSPASEIERRVAQDLAQSLRSHAGVTALRRGAINLDPSVRGLYAEQIGVFVDGTRTFAAGPARMDSALSHISPHALQSLRVVRGPYALTWGAGTLSAIQAETFKPAFGSGDFRLGGRAGYNYGSNGGANDGFASLHGSSDRVRFAFQHNTRIGSDYTDGSGDTVPGDYESFDTRWDLGGRLGRRTLLEYSGGFQRQNDIDYPGRLLDATFFETQSHALEFSHAPAEGVLTEIVGRAYANLKDHLMNNDNKPTASRNHQRTPALPIRVDLPAAAETVGGRFPRRPADRASSLQARVRCLPAAAARHADHQRSRNRGCPSRPASGLAARDPDQRRRLRPGARRPWTEHHRRHRARGSGAGAGGTDHVVLRPQRDPGVRPARRARAVPLRDRAVHDVPEPRHRTGRPARAWHDAWPWHGTRSRHHAWPGHARRPGRLDAGVGRPVRRKQHERQRRRQREPAAGRQLARYAGRRPGRTQSVRAGALRRPFPGGEVPDRRRVHRESAPGAREEPGAQRGDDVSGRGGDGHARRLPAQRRRLHYRGARSQPGQAPPAQPGPALPATCRRTRRGSPAST